jgi:hypothetical protein
MFVPVSLALACAATKGRIILRDAVALKELSQPIMV